MRRFICCFGKPKQPMQTDKNQNEEGSNVGGENLEHQTQHNPPGIPPSIPLRDLMDQEDSEEDKLPSDLPGETFTFEELSAATGNFAQRNLLGQGGFGKVYRGFIERIRQEVAIKKLNLKGDQGVKEFVREVTTLSRADHPNLVKLLGYCAARNERLLVYEYMPMRSLDRHLFALLRSNPQMDWNTRMKIALGAARGVDYLHNTMGMIYRDIKAANVLLDDGYVPKLSDFGIAREGPTGDEIDVHTALMGTEGYCAPEYISTARLTFKSDIYSFGVLLLEILTGRPAYDGKRQSGKKSLVSWVRLLWRVDENVEYMGDPRIGSKYPKVFMRRAFEIARLCIHENASTRPDITDVREMLFDIVSQPYDSRNHRRYNYRNHSSLTAESSQTGEKRRFSF